MATKAQLKFIAMSAAMFADGWSNDTKDHEVSSEALSKIIICATKMLKVMGLDEVVTASDVQVFMGWI